MPATLTGSDTLIRVNPAPKTPPAQRSSHLASWEFAETFVPLDEHAHAARRASAELGVEPISTGGAALLTLLARLVGARAAVEVGTGAGVSGLALLEGLTHDGILTSIDTEPEHQQVARKLFLGAGFPARRARLIAGGALNVLPKLSDGAYDLVFVDGDPLETVEYVAQAGRLLRPAGVLVVNHALVGGRIADAANEDDDVIIMREVLEAVQTMEEFKPLLLPVGDGLLIASRT
nr:methyltransferase [Propionibacterium sp.]